MRLPPSLWAAWGVFESAPYLAPISPEGVQPSAWIQLLLPPHLSVISHRLFLAAVFLILLICWLLCSFACVRVTSLLLSVIHQDPHCFPTIPLGMEFSTLFKQPVPSDRASELFIIMTHVSSWLCRTTVPPEVKMRIYFYWNDSLPYNESLGETVVFSACLH